MAKTYPFGAYDRSAKRYHAIPSVEKITTIRLNRAEWAAANARPAARSGGKRSKKSKKIEKAPKTPTRAIDAVRYNSPEIECLHCGRLGDDRACGTKCYDDFIATQLANPRVDIFGPGELGYGVYTTAKTQIKKGQYVEEYIGDIRPPDAESMYRFVIPPDLCVIDAEKGGNWTRFINSGCKPNLKAWASTVGKRHCILFQASKNIGPGEELLFSYGGEYFERAGFLCKCSAQDEPHMPKGGKKPVKPEGSGSEEV